MLDEVGGGVQHPGDDDLAFGKLDVFPDPPFVGVTGVGSLEGQAHGSGFQHGIDYRLEGDVVVVGAFSVAPAEMQPGPVLSDALQCVIDDLDVQFDNLHELIVG